MYSLNSVSIGPSKLLARVQYSALALLALAALQLAWLNWLLALPLLGLIAVKGYRLRQGRGIFSAPRLWSVLDGQWSLQLTDQPALPVTLEVQHIWPFLVIFRYQLEQRWHWEVIYRDAVQAETFRQLRAELSLYSPPPIKG